MSAAGPTDTAGAATTPARVPTATTTRFILLIAAVVATTVVVSTRVYLSWPGQTERLARSVATCQRILDAEPAWATGPSTPDEVVRVGRAFGAWRDCMRPVLRDQLVFTGAGLLTLGTVAGLLFLVNPQWTLRRRRLRPLSPASSPKLVDYLDGLRAELGLRRSPRWLLAPHRRTAGGQAFGLPGRRRIQLDAGLAVRYVTDRPAFRAVVLHELAHLKNRDVDITYLTIALWRAFLVLVALPYLVLLVHPDLFRAPLDWRWSTSPPATAPFRTAYLAGSLALLTALVYLTRNAILRVRETEADATAAAHDGPAGALPAVLATLPTPGRRARWGIHPRPRRRLAALRDPGLLLAGGVWELFAAGVAAGMFEANLELLLGQYAGLDTVLALTVLGAVAGALTGGLLAVAVWRATAGRAPGPRSWLGLPLALGAGLLAGAFLSLDTSQSATATSTLARSAPFPGAAAVLAAGLVLLAVWLSSVSGRIQSGPGPHRWAMPAVVAVSTAAGGLLLAIWLPASMYAAGFAVDPGRVPAIGAEIGWYAGLSRVVDTSLTPAFRLVLNAFTLPVVTLMCVVPVLAGLHRRRPAQGAAPAPAVASGGGGSGGGGPETAAGGGRLPVRRALVPALVATAVLAVVEAALPFAARTALPRSVRTAPDPPRPGLAFPTVADETIVVLACVAAAVVMAVVVARGGPHRPTLALLAGLVTAQLSTVVVLLVGISSVCYANVLSLDPAPTACLGPPPVEAFAYVFHFVFVYGVLIAVGPAVVVGLIRAGYRRWRAPAGTGSPSGPAGAAGDGPAGAAASRAAGRGPGSLGWPLALVAVLLVTAGLLTWGILPDATTVWLDPFGP